MIVGQSVFLYGSMNSYGRSKTILKRGRAVRRAEAVRLVGEPGDGKAEARGGDKQDDRECDQ